MKILLDECLPLDFRRSFPNHDAHTAQWAGLKGKKNGELLRAAENLLSAFELEADDTFSHLGNSEVRSYSNESYVHEAAGTRSINQLWNPSWAAADAEALRSKNVSKAAQESIKDLKDQAAAIGVR